MKTNNTYKLNMCVYAYDSRRQDAHDLQPDESSRHWCWKKNRELDFSMLFLHVQWV